MSQFTDQDKGAVIIL